MECVEAATVNLHRNGAVGQRPLQAQALHKPVAKLEGNATVKSDTIRVARAQSLAGSTASQQLKARDGPAVFTPCSKRWPFSERPGDWADYARVCLRAPFKLW